MIDNLDPHRGGYLAGGPLSPDQPVPIERPEPMFVGNQSVSPYPLDEPHGFLERDDAPNLCRFCGNRRTNAYHLQEPAGHETGQVLRDHADLLEVVRHHNPATATALLERAAALITQALHTEPQASAELERLARRWETEGAEWLAAFKILKEST